MSIPIIDLFAGPGGLGEGFMSLQDETGKSVFDIKLSIEKDPNAHKTLTWRSFYRQFIKEGKEVPKEYYQAYEEKNLIRREQIIESALCKYPEGKIARKGSSIS
jgi:DNA (cytosine-5)-methyltransferase 1